MDTWHRVLSVRMFDVKISTRVHQLNLGLEGIGKGARMLDEI